MAKDNLQAAHVSPVPYARRGHRVPQTVQRDGRQTETGHQHTVRFVEAGRRNDVDVPGELPGLSQTGHQRRRDRDSANG